MEHRERGKNALSALPILISLTSLFVLTQIILFIIHYKVTALLDALIHSSLSSSILLQSNIIFPIIGFICIQILAYGLFVGWIWFVSVLIGRKFHGSDVQIYGLSIGIWLLSIITLLSLNAEYFPTSFFSQPIYSTALLMKINFFIGHIGALGLLILTLYAYIHFFLYPQYRIVGLFLLLIGLIFLSSYCYNRLHLRLKAKSAFTIQQTQFAQPNIIIIGIDSLRPDFLEYLNHFPLSKFAIPTPYLNAFLKKSAVFTNAYTPLARTYPAWISILTALYPKHNGARNNLADPKSIISNANLAKHLKQMGYYTIYGTDENRFSNITRDYGFDRIIGPRMGLNDFIIAGLSDFPLTNLLVHSSIGQWLFPYHYANRAAAITYRPEDFLHLIQIELERRPNKPLFLAIHLCLTHWPFIWAMHSKKQLVFSLFEKYGNSVQRVDQQFHELLAILKNSQLLKHSLVVLLSDHGTTIGLPGDRIINRSTYVGDRHYIKWIPLFRSEINHELMLNIAYGHGSDLLSLKQYKVLLAFRGFGLNIPSRKIETTSALIDISPTILTFLKFPPMLRVDGISLASNLMAAIPQQIKSKLFTRPIFMETGATMGRLQTADIQLDKVVGEGINAYSVGHQGLLTTRKIIEDSIVQDKQRAILLENWLLVRYPEKDINKLVPSANHKQLIFKNAIIKPYFILVNIKSGQWSIGPDIYFVRKAPVSKLIRTLKEFYGTELI